MMLLCPRGCGVEIFDCVTRVCITVPDYGPTDGSESLVGDGPHRGLHEQVRLPGLERHRHGSISAVEEPTRPSLGLLGLLLAQVDEQHGEQRVPRLAHEERCVVALRQDLAVSGPVPSAVVGHDRRVVGEGVALHGQELDALHGAPLLLIGREPKADGDLSVRQRECHPCPLTEQCLVSG